MTPTIITADSGSPRSSLFLKFDSYGGVLVLIFITYILSTINLTMSWGPSVVIVVQIATVSIILRISRAAHLIRVVAAVCPPRRHSGGHHRPVPPSAHRLSISAPRSAACST